MDVDAELTAKGKTAPRITPADVEAEIFSSVMTEDEKTEAMIVLALSIGFSLAREIKGTPHTTSNSITWAKGFLRDFKNNYPDAFK